MKVQHKTNPTQADCLKIVKSCRNEYHTDCDDVQPQPWTTYDYSEARIIDMLGNTPCVMSGQQTRYAVDENNRIYADHTYQEVIVWSEEPIVYGGVDYGKVTGHGMEICLPHINGIELPHKILVRNGNTIDDGYGSTIWYTYVEVDNTLNESILADEQGEPRY